MTLFWNRIGLVLMLGLILAPLALVGSKAKAASAHPLGNFTVNRYSRLDISSSGVALRYVIDYAEVPAFQEIRAFDRDGDGLFSETEAAVYSQTRSSELMKNLDLRLNGQKAPLNVISSAATLVDGQGGLKTVRLVVDYAASLPDGWQQGLSASFEDTNYEDRRGWRELVVRPGEGINLIGSTAPMADISTELTAYPQAQLQSPPDVTSASFRIEPGTGVALAPSAVETPATRSTPKYLNGFAKLIERQELTLPFVALSLLAAMAWGAAHALGPGHGKTVVAAYLVGSRGTARHALLLGLTVTFAHVSSVVTLGLVTLYASNFLSTEDLYLWLSVASGLLVFLMGGALLWSRLRSFRRGPVTISLHGHDHEHSHDGHSHFHNDGDHSHDERLPYVVYAAGKQPHRHSHGGHGHSHEVTAPGIKGLVLLGISGGILPCPTALVVMLGAIALDRVEYGLVLITAFSIGLAFVLTAIGIALVYAGRMLEGSGRLSRLASAPFSSRLLQALPMGSAAIILVVGAVLTSNALGAAL